MNQPEQELAGKIARQLDHGVDQLDAGTRERLLAARKLALSRYRAQPAPLWGLAWAAPALGRVMERSAPGGRHLAVLSVLVLVLAGVVYWRSAPPANDLAEIDSGLLTDELPINAYLDKGFDSWLKRPSR